MKNQFFTLSCLIALTSILQLHAMTYEPSKSDGWELTPEGTNQEDISGQIQPPQPPFDFEKDEKYTALMAQAKKNGEEKEFKNLLNAVHIGCDSSVSPHIAPIKKTPLGILPLEVAIRYGHSTIAQLLAAYADDAEIKEAFIIAIANKQRDIASSLLENYTFLLDDTDKHKIIAVGCSDEDILEAIFPKDQKGSCNPYLSDYYIDYYNERHLFDESSSSTKEEYRNKSPLYTAVKNDNRAALQFFIAHGAGLLGVKNILLEATNNPQTKRYLLDTMRDQEKALKEKPQNLLCTGGCLLQ